jgi:hypothetical protein
MKLKTSGKTVGILTIFLVSVSRHSPKSSFIPFEAVPRGCQRPAVDAAWRTFANETLPRWVFCDQISRGLADRSDLVRQALKETPHG